MVGHEPNAGIGFVLTRTAATSGGISYTTYGELGMFYGCVQSEARLVVDLLCDRKLIATDDNGVLTKFSIRPEGYAQASLVKRGGDRQYAKGFVICRFSEKLDAVWKDVYNPVGNEERCPLLRVKDIHHNERIDDRICAEIRAASVVVVDLTDAESNFNVAFEAGFATALRKPVVWVKEADGGSSLKLPFDIITYNCLERDPRRMDEFKESFRFRLLAALEVAFPNVHQ
jgi:hypothetical protein